MPQSPASVQADAENAQISAERVRALRELKARLDKKFGSPENVTPQDADAAQKLRERMNRPAEPAKAEPATDDTVAADEEGRINTVFSKAKSKLGVLADGLGNTWDYVTGEDLRKQRAQFIEDNQGALTENQIETIVQANGRNKLGDLKIQWNDLQRVAMMGAEQAQKAGAVLNESDIEAIAERLMKSDGFNVAVKNSQQKVGSLWTAARATGNILAGGAMGGLGGALLGTILSPLSILTKPIAICIDKTFGTNFAPKAGPTAFIGGLAAAGAALLAGTGGFQVIKGAWNRSGNNAAVKEVYMAALKQGMRNVVDVRTPEQAAQEQAKSAAQVKSQAQAQTQTKAAEPVVSNVVKAAQEIITTFADSRDADVQMRITYLKHLMGDGKDLAGKGAEDRILHGIDLFKTMAGNPSKNPKFDTMMDAIRMGDVDRTKLEALLVKRDLEVNAAMQGFNAAQQQTQSFASQPAAAPVAPAQQPATDPMFAAINARLAQMTPNDVLLARLDSLEALVKKTIHGMTPAAPSLYPTAESLQEVSANIRQNAGNLGVRGGVNTSEINKPVTGIKFTPEQVSKAHLN